MDGEISEIAQRKIAAALDMVRWDMALNDVGLSGNAVPISDEVE